MPVSMDYKPKASEGKSLRKAKGLRKAKVKSKKAKVKTWGPERLFRGGNNGLTMNGDFEK